MVELFAFFDTIPSKFCEFSGEQAWETRDEFLQAFDDDQSPINNALRFMPVTQSEMDQMAEYRRRFESLIPEWASVPETEQEREKRLDQ